MHIKFNVLICLPEVLELPEQSWLNIFNFRDPVHLIEERRTRLMVS